MRIFATLLAVGVLLLSVAASAQQRDDVVTIRAVDPQGCCFEMRIENRHTPQSTLNGIRLVLLSSDFRFLPGAAGPWPTSIETDSLIYYGEPGVQLPPMEVENGFNFCFEAIPPGGAGSFLLRWETESNGVVVSSDTVSLFCSFTIPVCDSLRFVEVSIPGQVDGSCCYEFSLLNRHDPPGILSEVSLHIQTPNAEFIGTPSGPWTGTRVSPTIVTFESSGPGLESGKDLHGFNICVSPTDGLPGGVAILWITMSGGEERCNEVAVLPCVPKEPENCDTYLVSKGENCEIDFGVINTHRPQSLLDGLRISVLSTGASFSSVAAAPGWRTTSQTAVSVRFTKDGGALVPSDSATGFSFSFNPPASGLIRYIVCSMLQGNTICCDTLQVQCDPPEPTVCDSLLVQQSGSECHFDIGFVNQHLPLSDVNGFRIRLQSPGASIMDAEAPTGWYIERLSATEVLFRDSVNVVPSGSTQRGFILRLQAPAMDDRISFEWCTELDGGLLCCEYAMVTCERSQPRCDSLSITPTDYCSYRIDLTNTHIPSSELNGFSISLDDPGSLLLDAVAAEGWEIDLLEDRFVSFKLPDGTLPQGLTATDFLLSLVPSATSTRIPITYCTSLDEMEICCDTVSVFCEFRIVRQDEIDVITDVEQPCCFEFVVRNQHLPFSPLDAFNAEILTNDVTLFPGLIQSPEGWTYTTNNRRIQWRTSSQFITVGEELGGFIVCYDNSATGHEDFLVQWQTVNSGLILCQDTLTIKCDRTLQVELLDGMRPARFHLFPNYPNPFGSSSHSGTSTTTIRFELPVDAYVEVVLFDSHGRQVADIGSGFRTAGTWSIMFDAGGLPSGRYFYSLRSEGFEQTRSMLLVR